MRIDFELGGAFKTADIWMEEYPCMFYIHIREDSTGKEARCQMGRHEAKQMIEALQRFVDNEP